MINSTACFTSPLFGKANAKAPLQESRGRERQIEQLQREAEAKLLEVTDESKLMSSSMQDAQDWFKSRLDTVQDELRTTR